MEACDNRASRLAERRLAAPASPVEGRVLPAPLVGGRMPRPSRHEGRGARRDNIPKVRNRLAQFYRGPDELPSTPCITQMRDQLADSLNRARLYWIDNSFTDLAEHAASQMPGSPPAETSHRATTGCSSGHVRRRPPGHGSLLGDAVHAEPGDEFPG